MKKPDLVIGIDPGAQGSIAYEKKGSVVAVKMPKTITEIKAYLDYLVTISKNPVCVIEKLSLRPSDMIGGRAFRLQKMMKNYNALLNALELSKITYREIAPQTWQTGLRLKKKHEEGVDCEYLAVMKKDKVKNDKNIQKVNAKIKQKRKNRYKAFAQAKYPQLRATLTNCDALCLVVFGKLKAVTDPNFFADD